MSKTATKPKKAGQVGELGGTANLLPKKGSLEHKAAMALMKKEPGLRFATAVARVRNRRSSKKRVESRPAKKPGTAVKAIVRQAREQQTATRMIVKDNLQFFAPFALRASVSPAAVDDLLRATALVRQIVRYYRSLAPLIPTTSSNSAARPATALEMMAEDWISAQLLDSRIPKGVAKLVQRFLSERNLGIALQGEAKGSMAVGMQEWLNWLATQDRVALFGAITEYLKSNETAATEINKGLSQAGNTPYRDGYLAGEAIDYMFQLPPLPGDGEEEAPRAAWQAAGISEVGNMGWPGQRGGGVHYGEHAESPRTMDDVRVLMNRGPLGAASDADLDLFLTADAFRNLGGPGYDLGAGFNARINPSADPGPTRPPALYGESAAGGTVTAPAAPALPTAANGSGFVPFHETGGSDEGDDDATSFS
ncbi:MAG: hypothetical protein AB7S36_14385 [Planctomycetota bacterium]